MEALICCAGLVPLLLLGLRFGGSLLYKWLFPNGPVPRLSAEQSDESLVSDCSALADTWPLLRVDAWQQADMAAHEREVWRNVRAFGRTRLFDDERPAN